MRIHLSSRSVAVAFSAVLAFSATGCGVGDDLQAAITRFESNRAKALVKMNQVETRYVSCSVPEDRAGHDAFAEEWKKQWDEIEGEVKKLKRELSNVVGAGDKHFKKMNDLANTITSPQMKSSELNKNADLAKRWLTTIKDANANVKKMDDQVNGAKDIYKVLKLASLRSQAENKLAEIRQLNVQIKGTVVELERVTAEGRALLR